EAALVEGGLAPAVELARRYAEWDPRDEDVRVAVGSLLCLGGDEKRGLQFLETVQNDRARRRYAAIARNWGDVRALMVACAARAGIEPPPKPTSIEAGSGDPVVPRAVMRLRLTRAAAAKSPKGAVDLREAIETAKKLLDDPPHTRA